jgi:uncharacterized NAD-dependent epimerase/dehydratase family protein
MNAKRRDSGAMQLLARIREAVERGADAAESIHKQVAKLPLAPFEGVEPLEGALKDVRRMQERAIGAIYDLVRDINRELVRLAEESFAEVERQAKRRAPRKAARGPVRKAA